MTKNKNTVTKEIINFIKNSTKLNTMPKNNIVGYNHILQSGSSSKAICSDTAYYLLLNDLNKISDLLDMYLTVELPKNKFCALVSYFHSTNTTPTPLNLYDINKGSLDLAAEKLFMNKSGDKEFLAKRYIELKLWNNEEDYINDIQYEVIGHETIVKYNQSNNDDLSISEEYIS